MVRIGKLGLDDESQFWSGLKTRFSKKQTISDQMTILMSSFCSHLMIIQIFDQIYFENPLFNVWMLKPHHTGDHINQDCTYQEPLYL